MLLLYSCFTRRFPVTLLSTVLGSDPTLPPPQGQEDQRGGTGKNSLLFYSPNTLQSLTAPGGRAGRMIAAQLLAYYFTELKDDQLKKVSEGVRMTSSGPSCRGRGVEGDSLARRSTLAPRIRCQH